MSNEELVAALIDALKACGGNLTRAAARVGVSRGRAYRVLADSNVDLDSLRG
jgi:transcriptional regulator of acetoin/glycerol metabolism